jgi:two-component system, cell cycle sensor histidine kinase and response regulator CckA
MLLEPTMAYKLQDLIDIEQFQYLQDRLNEIYSFPSAIIDNEGNILTATAWQDVCTVFHRKNKECERDCLHSDQYIQCHLHEANPAVSYRCPRGLVDNATPIIIDGVHYGNFFTGQFFLEKPDLEFFRKQAKRFGFDEKSYLEAVKKVPIWSQDQLNSYLFFIKGLILIISESGLKKLKEIEARKQIEASEIRANTILNQMGDGFWVTEPQAGRVIEVNEAMCRMLGYSRGEMLNLSVADVEANDSPERIAERIRYILKNGATHFESHFRRKDGEIIDVDVNVTHLPEYNSFFGFHRDITARRRADADLKESEARYRILFEQAPDGVVILDPGTGRIIEFNDRACNLLGYSREEFARLRVADIEVVETPEDVMAHIQRILKEGYDDFETRHRTKEGEVRTIHVMAQVLGTREYPIYHCIWRDITERKKTEVMINDQLEELRRWQSATLGREDRVLQLKNEVNRLLVEAGKPPRYASAQEAGYE